MSDRIRAIGDFRGWVHSDLEQSIAARFESQVQLRERDLAVKTPTDEWSYGELNRRANRVAHGLISRSGTQSEPVLLLYEQGAPLIAAILGILKAGKFYVPLSAVEPRAVLEHKARHSGARLLLADEENRRLAAGLAKDGVAVVSVSEFDSVREIANPHLDIGPDALAYIYYTSGSTGPAKGVFDSQRNVQHNVLRYTNTLKISAADRMSLVQPPSFSGAVSNVFSSLLNGGALFPFDLRRDSLARLASWYREQRVTILHAVPAMFRALMEQDVDYPDVRVVRLEGDVAFLSDVDLFRRRFPSQAVLVNGLGTTETGIARQFFVGHEDSVDEHPLPIGYPVQDMDAFLMDDERQPVKTGEVGEIVVRSRFLALGYWQKPDLTEDRFPEDSGGGGRLYFSGDLGRMSADGRIVHLGRKDFRVKIRGQFVDIDEVEAALVCSPGVREAVVAVKEVSAEPVLIAYIVPDRRPPPEPAALREALSRALSSYMLPSAFVFLDELPLTRHGKVDRTRLATPESDAAGTGQGGPPRTDTERHLAAIWAAVLGLEQLERGSEFLDLGGDSLKAQRIASRVQVELNAEIPVEELLDASTIEHMAEKLEGRSRL